LAKTTTRRAAPALACEIGSQFVASGRLSGGVIATHSVRRLPAGAVTPGLTGTNIAQPDAVRRAVSEVLSAIGGGGKRDVITVLPDAAVRVLLLDFDTLPDNRDEATAIIRFRLKKSLPFDVEHAAVSFDRMPQATGMSAGVRTVVALSPANVVGEYEQAIRDAGYEPGVVLPSVLGALGIVDADRAAMLVKVDFETTSIALADASGLRLLRMIEHPSGVSAPDELTNAVHTSLIFYEDSTGNRVSRVFVTGSNADSSVTSRLAAENEIPVEALSTGASGADGPILAAVEGALAQ
jgi:type IV pilus assembly protein PilM